MQPVNTSAQRLWRMRKGEAVEYGPLLSCDSMAHVSTLVVKRRTSLPSGDNSDREPDLLALASRLGVDLQPMHPGIADAELGSYYYATIADPDTAAGVVSELLRSADVEAAYVKPPDEPA